MQYGLIQRVFSSTHNVIVARADDSSPWTYLFGEDMGSGSRKQRGQPVMEHEVSKIVPLDPSSGLPNDVREAGYLGPYELINELSLEDFNGFGMFNQFIILARRAEHDRHICGDQPIAFDVWHLAPSNEIAQAYVTRNRTNGALSFAYPG